MKQTGNSTQLFAGGSSADVIQSLDQVYSVRRKCGWCESLCLCEKLRRQFKDKQVDHNVLHNQNQNLSEIQKAAPTQSVSSGYKTCRKKKKRFIIVW